MNNYREIWDESHYKYGAAKDLKHVSWEEFKTIRRSEVKGGFLRVICEVVFIALIAMGLFYVSTLFNVV